MKGEFQMLNTMLQCDEYTENWDDESRQREWVEKCAWVDWADMMCDVDAHEWKSADYLSAEDGGWDDDDSDVEWVEEDGVLYIDDDGWVEEGDDDGLDVDGLLPEQKTSTAYYYFELYLNSLKKSYRYDVKERLNSGLLITHLTDVSYDEMKSYVRSTWIESVPPVFVIHATQE